MIMRVSRSPARLARLALLAIVGMAVLGVAAGTAGPARAAGSGTVLVLDATGTVDEVLAEYLSQGVAQAERDGDAAVVVRLNTPGGSLTATQKITGAFLEATVPIIVWVAPAGGRAASAGTFITMSANLAFMAPGTNIGAASPIDSSGADIPGTLGVKVKNDAVANISSIAQARGRNVAWAASTVRDAISSSATEAVAVKAVDGIAGSLDEVLQAATGRTVTVAGGRTFDLALAGLTTETAAMNPFQGLLHLLDDPNLTFILLLLGLAGLAFEFVHPNFLTGITGAILLILAAFGLGSLPLNVTGLALIVLGVGLVLMELTTPSHGALTIGAAICVALGAATLYTQPGGPLEPPVAVALPVIVVTTGLTAGFGVLITVVALRTRNLRRSPVLVGSLRVVGTDGVVGKPLEPLGSVTAAGEEWSARAADGATLPRGEHVRVVEQDGLVLIVERSGQPAAVPD